MIRRTLGCAALRGRLAASGSLQAHHSVADADAHVVARCMRQRNTILYEVTVEDPEVEVLVEPWVSAPRTLGAQPKSQRGSSAGTR